MRKTISVISLFLSCALASSETVYEYAARLSGYSGLSKEEWRGIAIAESRELDSAIGDDGWSIGRFQINEKFHEYYAWRYGEYDPRKPFDAARVSGMNYRDNIAYFERVEGVCDPNTWRSRRKDMAIAAHNQGLIGVKKNGVGYKYVISVRRNAR
jgi:hypothetical protein